MTQLTIGWVGLGAMGTPMAKNLLKKGFTVSVYNRSREKEKVLVQQGATSADSLKHISRTCDIIITMVTDDEAVQAVYNDLLADPVPGTLMIDMSTVSTQISKKIAKDCKDRKVRFLEAKVSGSVKPAEDGKLIIMAGGAFADFAQAIPLFEAMGSRNFLMGKVGIASAAKLCLNYFLALTFQGLAETVLFAHQQGIYKESILKLINESPLGSEVTRIKSEPILNNDFRPAFALKHITKDLNLIKNEGMAFPLFSPLLESYQAASQKGYGEDDAIAIIRFLEKYFHAITAEEKSVRSVN
jgi:3-hydroxyisobutyrate dehydrogenase